MSFDFDAMGELWYASKEDFIAGRNSPQGQQALAELKADEEKFVDVQKSVMWLGMEERLF